jgi:hypothetical protein
VSNHTHRTIPRPKIQDDQLPSSWGGGVWQLSLVTLGLVLWVVIDGWGSESQTAFRQGLLIVCLFALGAAVLFQQLHRAREAAAAKARR